MLMRTDPFRELDRVTQQVFGTAARPAAMPIDAYRKGDEFVVLLDLPGCDPASINLTVERNVLTVHAERSRPSATTSSCSSASVRLARSAVSSSWLRRWTANVSLRTTPMGCCSCESRSRNRPSRDASTSRSAAGRPPRSQPTRDANSHDASPEPVGAGVS